MQTANQSASTPFLISKELPALHFDPTPKCVYFGLDVIMAMVGDAFTRAGVQHGN